MKVLLILIFFLGLGSAERVVSTTQGKKILNQDPSRNCVCVPYYNCLSNMTINKYGVKNIDPRLDDGQNLADGVCEDILHRCCIVPKITTTSTESPLNTKNLKECGVRNPDGIGFEITGNIYNLAHEGEFPWMVYIFTELIVNDQKQINYLCGGSIISRRVVLTAAHCVYKLEHFQLQIRAGDWDRSSADERLPHQDRKVMVTVKHPQFNSSYLGYDFALLILRTPLDIAENVRTTCLPKYNEIINNEQCYVMGWGTSDFYQPTKYSSVLKAVQIPTVPEDECEQRLRETRLGPNFKLHKSLLCAGGIIGLDVCTGDGGSPLICPSAKNSKRYVQIGIVSWGIGCKDKYPAAYASIATIRPWIDATLKGYGINSDSYTLNSQNY